MTASSTSMTAPVKSIASTAYDTAWVAALPNPDDHQKSRFPAALSWISAHQDADGSWGSLIKYEHDRVICTLAALIPLVQFGRRDSDNMQIRRGERYLWQHAHLLPNEPSELVTFELLLPALMSKAAEAGVRVPPHLDIYIAQRQQKLALIPPHLIYSPSVTLAHSLEFLGPDVEPERLLSAQGANGSIGNSPAATAFLLGLQENASALGYIQRCLSSTQGNGVPVLDPCETFEAVWSAYNYYLGGTSAQELLPEPFRNELTTALNQGGVSLSPSFPIVDADDTAVAMLMLEDAGYTVDPTILQQFERDDYFVSFPYERHSSTGVNIHVLTALLRLERYPHREAAIRKILVYLRTSRHQGGYWFDKWHISPFYATCHAIAALVDLPPGFTHLAEGMIDEAVEWIVRTQNEDGSWGFWGMATTEETSYAIVALQHVRNASRGVGAAIAAGLAYLEAHRLSPRPALWIDKCLYYPQRIVDSAIDAVLR